MFHFLPVDSCKSADIHHNDSQFDFLVQLQKSVVAAEFYEQASLGHGHNANGR